MKLTKTRLVAGGVLFAFVVAGAAGGSVAYAASDDNPAVTIDAASDPTAAGNAMKLFPTATDKSFSASDNPVYSLTNWQLASDSSVNNPPNAKTDMTKTLKITHTEDFSLSVGGSVGTEVTVSALGFADSKIGVKFSADHVWTTGVTESEEVQVTAVPGKSVWILAAHTQAVVTGDYTFTADGTTYHINNVTITQPAATPGGNSDTATVFYAKEAAITQAFAGTGIASTDLPSGLVPISKTPALRRLTAQLPVGKLPASH